MSTRSASRRFTIARLLTLASASLVIAGLAGTTGVASASASPGSDSPRLAAGDGTLTYVQGGDVWVARQDGTGARRVTSNGSASSPWRSPTQSDDGEIVAGRGNLIYRMDQWGTVLNTIDPPDLQNSAGEYLTGAPAHLAVSPDGAKIAYTYEKYSCPLQAPCKIRYVTAFTSATALSDWRTWGVTYYDNPSWITNSRVAVNADLIDNINLYDLGRGLVHWFDEDDYTTYDRPLFDFEVSRGAPYAAAVRNTGDEAQIVFYQLSGNYRDGGRPPIPTGMCETSAVLGITSPTWSADGALAAWQEPDGVWTAAMGSTPCQSQPVLTIRGASSPSFSPAALQTTRPNHPDLRFTVKAKPQVKGAARVGRQLTATAGTFAPSPTTLRFQWLRDKSVIKGATKATYKVTKNDRRHDLRVQVTGTRSGYSRIVVVSAPVRVKG